MELDGAGSDATLTMLKSKKTTPVILIKFPQLSAPDRSCYLLDGQAGTAAGKPATMVPIGRSCNSNGVRNVQVIVQVGATLLGAPQSAAKSAPFVEKESPRRYVGYVFTIDHCDDLDAHGCSSGHSFRAR